MFDGCDKIFSYGGKAKHVEKVHLGIRYPCPCADCDKVFTKKTSLPIHIKTVLGTLEQAAEMREKRLQLRSLLAEKEARVFAAPSRRAKTQQSRAHSSVNITRKPSIPWLKLRNKTDEGTVSSSSIKTVNK